MDLVKIITTRLKEVRTEFGYTQNEIAEILDVDRTTYNKIENGTQPITVAQLVALCKMYGRTINYFLDMGCDELTSDEVEVLDIYRSTPDDAKDYAIMLLRGWRDQTKGKL